MGWFSRLAVRAGFFAVSLASSIVVQPAVAASADAILILDASGSMWGQVEGQTKISAAKKAVDSILAKWRPDDRLGLMAYGHRTKGDCKDIELLVPVSRFDPQQIKAAVAGINPKGKTPMADSLKAAAAALRSSENKATVVLVSDGVETCAPDPCAVAADLKKAGVGFTAHVIGFDVTDPVAKNQLQCIARATGGVYLDAGNASGLENALGRAVAASQGAKVQSEAPAKPVKDVFEGKNVRGVVRLAAGLDPISDKNVAWVFYQDKAGEKGERLDTYYGSPFSDTVAPGSYIVEIEYGEVKRPFAVKVENGKRASWDFVIDAGFVTSEGAAVGGEGNVDNVTWEMLDSSGELVTTQYDPVPRFVLPEGQYKLRLSKGNVANEHAFSISAGDQVSLNLAMDAGRLLVTAVYARGGPKVTSGLTVEVAKPNNVDGEAGEHIASHYDELSKFDLPSGDYRVTVSVGAARRGFDVKVVSGQTVRLAANLEAGVLAFKRGAAQMVEILETESDINGERNRIGAYHDDAVNVALNAGTYLAVVDLGNGEKREKEFSVTAGKRLELDLSK